MTLHPSRRFFGRLILAPAGLIASLALAQTPPEEPEAPKPAPAPTAAEVAAEAPRYTAPEPADEVVTLSPFEVVSDTRGYYSANTMSGTRLNTKIEDLASSITVVTPEQMSDFAMLDINDIFLYTANTEGTGTYTDVTVDRNGQVTDNSQGNPTGANRVRGIAAANISYGNFEMMGRTPIDPLIVDGVEVSRGPNANVFGLGNPSGTVNQVPAAANFWKTRLSTQLRADSDGGWRATFDVNQVISPNKLAVRVNGGRQHEDWQRKPTGFETKRLNAMVKFRPFENTTITASYLYYYGYGNRPNNTTPRDYVSAWVNAGKPAWDPVSQTYTLNGQTYGMNATGTGVVAGSTTPITSDDYLPAFFSRDGGAFQRSNIFVDRTGITYWTAPTSTVGDVPGASGSNGTIRLMGPSASTVFGSSVAGRFDDQPLFTTTPTVSSQELYDWTKINLSSIDRMADRTDTYLAQIDQIIYSTPRDTLAASAAFFREDAERYRRTPASNSGTSGQTGQLWVDVNARNLDGTVNPNFGRTYIGVIEPRTSLSPARYDTYRAQLAYKLDLTHEKGWVRWLGSHQVSGYYDYKYRISRQYSYRDVMTSSTGWINSALANGSLSTGMARGNQSSITGGPQAGPNIMRGFYRYYVGDSNGSNVDYAPSDFSYGSYPFVWGNTGSWHYDPIQLGQVATTDGTGGTANLLQIVKTPGAVIQSHFLDDALVTTFGARKDVVYSKNGATPQTLVTGVDGVSDNTTFDYSRIDRWQQNWRYSSGRTTTGGVVVRPFRDFPFLTRWARSDTGVKSVLGDFLRGLSFTYNRSNNFIPAPPAVDLLLNPLPNTTGDGKDMGVWINMFDGKLVVRVNRYENNQYNARNGDANTIAQRVLRHDLDAGQTDSFRLAYVATSWPLQSGQTVYDLIQIDETRYNALVDNYQNGTLAATNDITGKGTEIEINYNPTQYWTVTAAATDTRAINSNVSTSIRDYINQRWELWTTVVDPNISATADNPDRLWWKHNYGGSQTAEQNYYSFIDAPYRVIEETQGKSQPAVRRYAFKLATNLKLDGLTDHSLLKKFSVGGAVRWEDKGAIGYYGKDWQHLLATNQSIMSLDPDNPIWDPAHYYFDAFVAYRTKLFRKVGLTLRLNVKNIQESGGLKPIRAFPDGVPYAYRIVDPRQFILTATFDY